MKTNGKYEIIFAGDKEKVMRFKKRTIFYYLIPLIIIAILISLFGSWDIANDEGISIWEELKSFWIQPIVLISAGVGYSVLFLLGTLPQSFEIRENGIALPIRTLSDIIKRRERFIEFKNIKDIYLGENPILHEIILENGKTVMLGIGGGFFLELSVGERKINQMEKVLKKLKEELNKEENKIKREQNIPIIIEKSKFEEVIGDKHG